VDCDEIHTVLPLFLNNIEEFVRVQLCNSLAFLHSFHNGLVNGDRAYGKIGVINDKLTDLVQVATGTQVHYCVCTCFSCILYFF